MILTDKPKKKVSQDELPFEETKTTLAKRENVEVLCYFLGSQDGPKGFENCTLLSITLGSLTTGYMEELNKYVLPRGSFYYDRKDNRFFIKPAAVEKAKQLAREYKYTIIGA